MEAERRRDRRGLDVDDLEGVPGGAGERQVDRAEEVRAIDGQLRLAVACNVDRDWACGRLRQHHAVGARGRHGRIRVRVVAVRDQQRIDDGALAAVRARAVRRDDNALGVRVDHRDADGADGDAVIRVAVDRARPLNHRVLDRDLAVARRHTVGRRVDGHDDRLREVPVGGREEQRRAAQLAVQVDVLHALAQLRLARRSRGRRHEDV